MILYGKILAPDLVSEFFHIKSCLQTWCQKAVQQPLYEFKTHKPACYRYEARLFGFAK